jgi:hypothetical protein
MNTPDAVNVLTVCENGLRRVAAESLSAGDYDAARQIMGWGENVASMLRVARGLADGRNLSAKPLVAVSATAISPKRKSDEDEYPQFARRGDELVKIGWSKQDRKEYNHRAPRAALEAVVNELKRIAADGSGFNSEQLSQLNDSSRGGVFPLYQIFVVLAWLRKLGLVKQHGRKGGYSLIIERPLDATIAATWLELPTWRD